MCGNPFGCCMKYQATYGHFCLYYRRMLAPHLSCYRDLMSLHVDVFIPTISARYETYDTMLAGTSVCTVTTTTLQVGECGYITVTTLPLCVTTIRFGIFKGCTHYTSSSGFWVHAFVLVCVTTIEVIWLNMRRLHAFRHSSNYCICNQDIRIWPC